MFYCTVLKRWLPTCCQIISSLPPPLAPFIFFIYLLKAKINANGEEYSC